MIYTVTLNPALDYILRLEDIFENKINRADKSEFFFGGKGINVSVMLTRLGAENTALGFTAGFTGNELERLLNEEGVKHNFTRLEKGFTRINVKIRASAELDINADGPEISENDLNAFLDNLASLTDGDWLVLSGATPKSLSENVYALIAEQVKNKDVKLVIDAEGELLLNALKYKPILVKPNHIELGAIFGKELKSEEEIICCAKELQKLGAINVLVSRAEEGAVLIDGNGGIHTIKNCSGTLINSVGCGDSMVAGFIAGYIKSGDFEEALKIGTACGNATAFTDGLASKTEIDSILKKI